MANDFYDNSDNAQRFQPGTTVRGAEVDGKFDQVSTGFELVNVETDRALKFPVESGVSQEFTATKLQRRRKVLGFDENGDLALTAGFSYRGDWTTATDYFVNDVFRDPGSKNLYVAVTRHTSDTIANDLAGGNIGLAINVAEVEALKNQAGNSAAAAKESEDEAEEWASKPEGALVDGAKYSALHYAAKAAADAETTASDREATGQDAQATAADRLATGQDRIATGQDRVATGQDVTTASSATSAAQGYSQKSAEWAESPENAEVEPGQYSAKHWAIKAASYVANGVIDDGEISLYLTWSSQKLNNELNSKAASSHGHSASDISSGTFAVARIPNLDASKITSGTFSEARIPTASSSIKGGSRIWRSGTTGYIYTSN